MQQPHLDEVVEGPSGAPGLLPFFGHHLGPLLGVTLGSEGDEGRRLACNYWVMF